MKILTSPDDIAASLPDYPFASHHVAVPDGEGGTLRVHYVDEGPREAPPVSDTVRHGYQAPYPDPSLTIGSRAFTQLLPTRPDNPMLPDNWHAWKVLERFSGPFVTIYSDRDIVAPSGYRQFVERVPGARGQPHVILAGGGHFLQEDVPDDFNRVLLDWLGAPG